MVVGTTARQPVMFGIDDEPEVTFRQLALAAAVALAAVPPAIRAVRIDPAQTLRSE